MSGARADILARLHGALGLASGTDARRAAAQARLVDPPRVAAPVRASGVDRVRAFCDRAEEVGATTARVATRDAIGDAVAAYLRARNLAFEVKVSPELATRGLMWPASLTVSQGRATGDELAGVAEARAAVAETGTVVLASGGARPTTLNFLPETHIVVVPAARIVGTYEEMWDRLRAEATVDGLLPRAVNWITGPSRTADIEQTILTGVHGPKRLHVIVLDEDL